MGRVEIVTLTSSSLREVLTWRFREKIARSKKTPALQATSRVNSRFHSTLDTDLQNLYKLTDRELDDVMRIVCNESKYCHITPLLVIDLHWLPVKLRIEFKILLNVFKIFNGLAPSYS